MFTLPPLPYAKDALAPHISAETMDFHYSKHHAGYVKKLNELVVGTTMADMKLDALIMSVHESADGNDKKVFNNAAQTWNHTFFWSSMSTNGGGAPQGDISDMIDAEFAGIDGFNEAFVKATEQHFGSGWVWLVEADGKLEIMTTSNADLPMTSGKTALLVCDIWEHAYYLDYQNRKPDFVKTWQANLINWDFANSNVKTLATA